MSETSRMNKTTPSQTPFTTKIVFTFPYNISDIEISPCGKILFKEIKIDGEQIVCNDRGYYTPSIQRLEEEWRRCREEASKLLDEMHRLQKKFRIAILGWKKIEEKINELNRLYEEKREDCDALFKELNEKTNKLQSKLRRVIHERSFEILIKPYLMATSVTDEEVNKLRTTWLKVAEMVSELHTPMAVPIPKGICKVSIATNIYGTVPFMFTDKKYIVEIYMTYGHSEFETFIDALMQQYRDLIRDLINAGCLTISTDVV